MRRREFLRLVGVSCAAGVLYSLLPDGEPVPAEQQKETSGAAASRPSTRPPNVVLIISDDHAWTDYGFMGHPVIRTPRLDRLALESLVFTRGYVPTALCRPSLASISTGLHPHQHRIVGNDPKGGMKDTEARGLMVKRFRELPCLARLLGQAGYVSFQTGKWWEGSYRCGGFTEGMTHGNPKRGGRHGDAGLAIGRQGIQPILDFLDGRKADGKPFFLWYAPMMPHEPHSPPKRLLDGYAVSGRPEPVSHYYAMCEWFDETCGQLLDALDERGQTGNTIVAYLADNGWVQWEGKRQPLEALRGKRTPYEGGIRTPIMLRWPGHIRPRRNEEHLAGSIDLLPTILRACGVRAPGGLSGLDLLNDRAVAARKAIYGASFEHDVQDLADPAASLISRWCIEGQWKLILPYARRAPNAKPELFDLQADPREKTDLAAKQPGKIKHLTELLDRWWAVG